jgi:galactose mutarotase-like enzyme
MIYIENDYLRVGVAPAYGARVVSVFDKTVARQWITQGSESGNTGEDAIYLGPEAVGWDECFPTVGSWDASATPWRRRLRDHGDLWGRPWQVEEASRTALTTSFAGSQFRFSRTLRLDGRTLLASYSVQNLSWYAIPYLWALHALLAVTPEGIELPGIDKVTASYVSLAGTRIPLSEISWSASAPLPFALECVQPANSGFAGKFYASNMAERRARIGHPGEWLEIAWDPSIEHLGIWLTYGGWPETGGHQEAALEPTSSAADHLGQVIAAGAPPLAPRGQREWQVTFTVAT